MFLLLAFLAFVFGIVLMSIDPLNTESRFFAVGGLCWGVSLVFVFIGTVQIFL